MCIPAEVGSSSVEAVQMGRVGMGQGWWKEREGEREKKKKKRWRNPNCANCCIIYLFSVYHQ